MGFLVVDHVSHTYFSKDAATEALRDIYLTVNEGEFVSFIGPSGCGKTTLLSIIAGLFQPTYGNVYIENQKVYGNKDLSIGYMLQQEDRKSVV